MKNILKLNEISPVADKIFSSYNYTKECDNPHGIMLRSFNMHEYELGDKLLAVARAGAGVNNIPIDKCTEKGIVVFNTPGANANAVKELVLCAMFMAARNVLPATKWVSSLKNQEGVEKLVEKGKSAFVGSELSGKKLGVVGLGAIGTLIANTAVSLGMEVIGYDPFISVDSAWKISRAVKHSQDLNALISDCDFVTLHIPYNADTKHTMNEERLSLLKKNAYLINCARGELVDDDALLKNLKDGNFAGYITDFPNAKLIDQDKVITLPHIGASTAEAEDNCAYMAAKQLVDYIENGNITNSVNFPAIKTPRSGVQRLSIIHQNVQSVLSKITAIISDLGINIANMSSTSRKDVAYAILDLDEPLGKDAISAIAEINGVVKVRAI